MTANLLATAAGLEADSVIKASRDESSNIRFVELTEGERSRGREDYDFYCFLIWPYVEASWLAAVSLMALTPPPGQDTHTWIDMKAAQDATQLAGKTLYHQGDLSYYEAVNKEVLLRSYDRFLDEGIFLLLRSKDPTVPTRFKLAPAWTPGRDDDGNIKPEGRLWDFIEMMWDRNCSLFFGSADGRSAKSRREGKNRRDGATVRLLRSSLVLNALADCVIGIISRSAPRGQDRERVIRTGRSQGRHFIEPIQR